MGIINNFHVSVSMNKLMNLRMILKMRQNVLVNKPKLQSLSVFFWSTSLPSLNGKKKKKKINTALRDFFLLVPLNQHQFSSRKNGPFIMFVVLIFKNIFF